MDRLMLMLTRSCELRCSYCWVALTEDHYQQDHPAHPDSTGLDGLAPGAPLGDMSAETLRRSMDLLISSDRPSLGLQLFGGEPSRRWEELVGALEYVWNHPDRRDRPVEMLFTTNGVGMTAERLERIRDLPVTIQFSLDGDERSSRFRRGHLLSQEAMIERVQGAIDLLNHSGLRWFMNATLPPAAAGEVMDRYRWARESGVPAMQINYATGMSWSAEQEARYLEGLQEMLVHHHHNQKGFELFNWGNDADPVPLCGDIIVDVDGTIFQTGALFHERRFPALKPAYRRSHLDEVASIAGLRITLNDLWRITSDALSPIPRDLEVFEQNMLLGASVDLVVQFMKKRLGRTDRARV